MKNTLLFLFSFFPNVIATVDLKPYDSDNAVIFIIKNFGINTDGELKGLKGTIKWDAENPPSSVFNVSVDVKTINTGIEMRDNHLKNEEYFDAEKYPIIQLASTAVSADNITGNLTIKGITKEVTFPYKATAYSGYYLFEGSFSINRKDFGIGAGSMSLGTAVTVNLKVKAKPLQ